MIFLGKRKFAKKTVFDSHLEGKKHLKAAEDLKKKRFNTFFHSNSYQHIFSEPDKAMASLEYKVFRYAVLLQKVIEKTIRNIEAKQAKNWEELQVCIFLRFNQNLIFMKADMEDDSAEEEIYSEEDDDDEDEIIQGIRVWNHSRFCSTTLLTFDLRITLLDGTENRFLIGCTSCMVWELNTNVKYVVMPLTWAVATTNVTFK